MIPPDVIVIAVTVMTSTGPVMIIAVAGPVIITTVAGPARKTVIYMSAAVITPAGPVIITAVAGPVMKAVIDMGTTAMSSTAVTTASMTATGMTTAMTATGMTTAMTATAAPRFAVINGYSKHSQCQGTHCETLRDRLQPIRHNEVPDVPPIASTQRACPCPS
jgi:hypothetical protein